MDATCDRCLDGLHTRCRRTTCDCSPCGGRRRARPTIVPASRQRTIQIMRANGASWEECALAMHITLLALEEQLRCDSRRRTVEIMRANGASMKECATVFRVSVSALEQKQDAA